MFSWAGPVDTGGPEMLGGHGEEGTHGEMGLEGSPVPALLAGTGVFPVRMELRGLYPSMPPASPVRALGLPLSDLAGIGAVCDGVEVSIPTPPLPRGWTLPALQVPEEAFPTRMGPLCHWPPPHWR